ncbi:hypothetical protein EJ110_NYTH25685 [Nymphaea thermarum]|nr:hypothetical protein EJ110_NYTH25685 [Nymphaea thermarum]
MGSSDSGTDHHISTVGGVHRHRTALGRPPAPTQAPWRPAGGDFAVRLPFGAWQGERQFRCLRAVERGAVGRTGSDRFNTIQNRFGPFQTGSDLLRPIQIFSGPVQSFSRPFESIAALAATSHLPSSKKLNMPDRGYRLIIEALSLHATRTSANSSGHPSEAGHGAPRPTGWATSPSATILTRPNGSEGTIS